MFDGLTCSFCGASTYFGNDKEYPYYCKSCGKKNICWGPRAGDEITEGRENICLGNGADSGKYNRCIILGPELKARHDYHFLFDDNEGVLIDYTMTEYEWNCAYAALTNIVQSALSGYKGPRGDFVKRVIHKRDETGKIDLDGMFKDES